MSYVLIVEDDDSVRTVLSRFLRSEGYGVQTVTNGKEAMAFLAEALGLPDLILLDLNMPEMNGWELVSELERHRVFSNLPVVAITATALENVRPISVDAIMSKPLNLEQLLEHCRRWCEAPESIDGVP